MPQRAVETSLETKEQVSRVSARSNQPAEIVFERSGHTLTQTKSVAIPPDSEYKNASLISNN